MTESLALRLKPRLSNDLSPHSSFLLKMKRLAIPLVFVLAGQACQKKQYATFDYPASHLAYQQNETGPISRSTHSAPIAPVAPPTQQGQSINPASSTATARTRMVSSTIATNKRDKVRNKTLRSNKRNVRIVQENDMKEASKIKNPAATSLILSVAGLVVSVVSVAVTAPIWIFAMGTLMGAAGLVLGISALRRIKNQTLPASGKGMAIAGLIIGALTTLAGLAILYTFAVVATYGI